MTALLDLQLTLKHIHWNVVGPTFIGVHEMLDPQVDGVREFTAVINPPHATILAVGAGEERAVVRNRKLAVATMMSVTLSVDHRVIDGALGAELLAAFKAYIEDPVTMLV